MRRVLMVDEMNGQMWRGKQRLELPPKAFAVLHYLMEHADRVVSKDELLTAVWPGTVVSEWALTTCLRKIRRALGERAETSRYIATVHRRGYRFIGEVISGQSPVASKDKGESRNQKRTTESWQLVTRLFGRETELAQLHKWRHKALEGERQVVFVTGEAGIGKTTLVDAFVAQVQTHAAVQSPQLATDRWPLATCLISRGQCIEHYGAGEAYLPVLEALGRLCGEPGHERLLPLLRQYAPTWLVQMPWLLSSADREELQRQVIGATRERMLREMAEMIETLTGGGVTQGSTLLILVLEDLHWSDYATLDLLSSLAQRRDAARLFLLATFRPVEVIVREHPLRGVKQELQVHRQCSELRLEGLTEAAVEEYLAMRFAGEAIRESSLPSLARVLHQQTNGNPLFVVNTVDDLVARGVLVQHAGHWEVQGKLEEIEIETPQNLRQMIERHIERLSPEEEQILEVASVAGVEFSTAAVAAGIGTEIEIGKMEEWCQRLARREQFLQLAGLSEWPDGTAAERYRFIHALYQHVLYERIAAGRRKVSHQRIGERLETAYSERVGEIAAELAMHFEQGRDHQRAVRYHQQAAETALRRSANHEAIAHLTKGLKLLETFPNSPERIQQELQLQIPLAVSLLMTKGYAAPEAANAYLRARELCQQIGETPQLIPVLMGLVRLSVIRAELQTACDLVEQVFTIAQSIQDPAFLVEAHRVAGGAFFYRGELSTARAHLEQGMTLYDPQKHSVLAFLYGEDPGVTCHSFVALTLWCLGYPDQALQRAHDALILAQQVLHPFTQVYALGFAAWLHQFRREGQECQACAEATLLLSREQGFDLFSAMGASLQGWTLAAQGQVEQGIFQMREGILAFRSTGAGILRPYFFGLLAEAYGQAGRPQEGLTTLAEALTLVDKNGERVWEAELYRLKGELTLQKFQTVTENLQLETS